MFQSFATTYCQLAVLCFQRFHPSQTCTKLSARLACTGGWEHAPKVSMQDMMALLTKGAGFGKDDTICHFVNLCALNARMAAHSWQPDAHNASSMHVTAALAPLADMAAAADIKGQPRTRRELSPTILAHSSQLNG